MLFPNNPLLNGGLKAIPPKTLFPVFEQKEFC